MVSVSQNMYTLSFIARAIANMRKSESLYLPVIIRFLTRYPESPYCIAKVFNYIVLLQLFQKHTCIDSRLLTKQF